MARAVPTRTRVPPSAMATSRSWLMPMDSSRSTTRCRATRAWSNASTAMPPPQWLPPGTVCIRRPAISTKASS